MQEAILLIFCFLGLQLTYLTWGLLQEKIMTQVMPYIGCSNKSARFNFVINAPFIQKVLIFQYKVYTLRLIVEHSIRQMSPMTLLSRGGRQCTHFKSCALVGTPHTKFAVPMPSEHLEFYSFCSSE